MLVSTAPLGLGLVGKQGPAVKIASPGKTTTRVFNEIILKRFYIINIII
jgi:hypothetical protein